MPNPPDIHQNVVLHLDTASLTAELDKALRELAGGLGTKFSQLSTPALTPGAFASGLPDLTYLFNSLSQFGTALDGLTDKLNAIQVNSGGGGGGGSGTATTKSPTNISAGYPVAATGTPGAATPADFLNWAITQPGMYTITQQLSRYGNMGQESDVLRQADSRANTLIQRIEQITTSGDQRNAAELTSAVKELQTIAQRFTDAQTALDKIVNYNMAAAPQLISKINSGQGLVEGEWRQAQLLTNAANAQQYVPYVLNRANDAINLGTTATLPNPPSQMSRIASMFTAGAIGYGIGQQISSGIGGALSPLEPMMGGNIINGTSVAMQGAPIYNTAAQGQTNPLNFGALQTAYTQNATTTGMPMFQSLETAVGAQMASGIAGGMVFFQNAADLYQFSQAIGVSGSLMSQVAGQAQVGGVSNFGGYVSGLLGMNQGTGLTNTALLTEIAQLQQTLISTGLSPAGAQLGFGTFATAAHLGGVNGQQSVGLFNALNSGQTGPAGNIFQGYAQLAAEGNWLKIPGVANSLGFSTNSSIGAGEAMSIFQQTPLMQGTAGAAKMLSMLNYLTPLAQGSATNPNDLIEFMSSTGMGSVQSNTLRKLLANPTSAHYLSGALSADMGGGSAALHSYIGDVNNKSTQHLLGSFVSSFQQGPQYSIDHLNASIQNAKFTLGTKELSAESFISGSPLVTGPVGFAANVGMEALPFALGGILANAGIGGLGKLLPGLFTRTVATGAGEAAAGGAAADVVGAGGLAALVGSAAFLPVALGTAAILATPGHGPRKVSGGPMSQLWNWLNTDPFASPSGAGSSGLSNGIITSLEIQNLKIDSMQVPGTTGLTTTDPLSSMPHVSNLVFGPPTGNPNPASLISRGAGGHATTAQQEAFLKTTLPIASAIAKSLGHPGDTNALLAQFADETNWGLSMAATNNYGNIEYGSGPNKGKSIPYGSASAFEKAYEQFIKAYPSLLSATTAPGYLNALNTPGVAGGHYSQNASYGQDLAKFLPQILSELKKIRKTSVKAAKPKPGRKAG